MQALFIILLVSILIIVFIEGYNFKKEKSDNGKYVCKTIKNIVKNKKKIELLKYDRDYAYFSIDNNEIYYNYNPIYQEVIYLNGFYLNSYEREYLKPTLDDIIGGKWYENMHN